MTTKQAERQPRKETAMPNRKPQPKWTKDNIRVLIAGMDAVQLMRPLRALYERQTSTEKDCHQTLQRNGQGFTAFDAEILTSIFVAARDKQRGRLWGKQVPLVRRKLMRYAGQLADVANANDTLRKAQQPEEILESESEVKKT